MSSIATTKEAKREQRPKTAKAAPTRVRAAGSGAIRDTASHASALSDGLRSRGGQIRRPERRRVEHTLDGTYRQASADGAVEWAEQRLARRIRAHLTHGALEVTLTDNRYTMISVRRDTKTGPSYRVRLHHMFADASPLITRALAHYIGKNDSSASRVLGTYIDGNQHRVRKATRRSKRVHVETKGSFHDLQALFDDLNRRYFGGQIEAIITWGQRTGKQRRRNSIKMGSYSVEEKLIRMHRSLDRKFVPRYFVEWIIYHEMLHQVHHAPLVNGRRQFHSKPFLEDEARFEHYNVARAWERANLEALLTY